MGLRSSADPLLARPARKSPRTCATRAFLTPPSRKRERWLPVESHVRRAASTGSRELTRTRLRHAARAEDRWEGQPPERGTVRRSHGLHVLRLWSTRRAHAWDRTSLPRRVAARDPRALGVARTPRRAIRPRRRRRGGQGLNGTGASASRSDATREARGAPSLPLSPSEPRAYGRTIIHSAFDRFVVLQAGGSRNQAWT